MKQTNYFNLGIILISLVCISGTSIRTNSEIYKVDVTRIAKDLSRIDGTNYYIETRYCYEYTYGGEAYLNTSSDELCFDLKKTYNSNDESYSYEYSDCYDINQVYQGQAPSSYNVKAVTDDDEIITVELLLYPSSL